MILSPLLAYRPILDPLPADGVWWLLLVPIALFIAIAYKAVRVPRMQQFATSVIVMTLQILLGTVALGLAAYIVIEHLAPRLAI